MPVGTGCSGRPAGANPMEAADGAPEGAERDTGLEIKRELSRKTTKDVFCPNILY